VEKLTIGAGAGTGTGNAAANTILGLAGDDTLYGLGGNDTITGGAGDDFLYGGAGLDQLTGGLGADRFVLDGPTGSSADKIMDFSSAQFDKLGIKGTDYGLGAGALDASRFVVGTSATSASGVGQFVYNATNKTLYWDADGSGAGAAVIVATFATTVSLSASDFVVM
jgi:Ca2+-binding RTX toxin-like protein